MRGDREREGERRTEDKEDRTKESEREGEWVRRGKKPFEVNINTLLSLSDAHSLFKQTPSPLLPPVPANAFEVFQTSLISCPKEGMGATPHTPFSVLLTHTHTLQSKFY